MNAAELARKLLLVPPLPEAEKYAAVLEKRKHMSREEFLAPCVRAGTHTPDGQLAPYYRGEEATHEDT